MHVDKQAHAVNDADRAAEILALLEACGANREATTRRGHGVRKFTKRADTDQVHGGAQRGKKLPELVRGAAGTALRIWDDYVAEWAEYSALCCQNLLIWCQTQ